MLNRLGLTRTLPAKVRGGTLNTVELIEVEKFKPLCSLSPTAIYFRTVQRGPIEKISAVLRESLSSLSLLCTDFIGSCILEIKANNRLVQRTVSTFGMLGIQRIKNFDMFGALLKKHNPYQPWADL